jgi:hypothetical protein
MSRQILSRAGLLVALIVAVAAHCCRLQWHAA